MNNLHIEIGEISVIINVIVRVITATIFCVFLIPLFWKEANVKNGLKTLRWELLFTGSIIFLVNTSGLFVIIARFFKIDITKITEIITYFNSFGFLAYALLKYKIYTQKYTPANKRLHEEFEKLETKTIQNEEKNKNKQEYYSKESL